MIEHIEVRFKRLHETVQLPKAWTLGSVGLDVHAHILTEQGRPTTAVLAPRSTRNITTGLLIEPPAGFVLFVCTRSGYAKDSIFVTNAPGIIDPDYRGELRILLYNGSHETKYVRHGDRIAQLIAAPAVFLTSLEVDELSKTERGEHGFGSTGL